MENDSLNQSEKEIASINQPKKKTEAGKGASAPSSGLKVPKVVMKPESPVETPLGSPGTPRATSSPTPTQIGQDKKKGNANRFIMGFAGGLLILFVIFLILMVLVMAKGRADSPILKAFGVQGGDVKSFLLTLISSIFGFLAFIFLAVFIVGIFRVGMARKSDTIMRNRGLRLTFIGLIPLILVMMVWVGLFTFISRVPIGAEKVVAEIIATNPADLTNLVAPVEVSFSAERVAKALQNNGLVIKSLDWDLEGKGVFDTPAAQPEITHLYETVGNYQVGLRATFDGKEAPRVYTFALAIPEAVFAADPLIGTAPLVVTFSASHLTEGMKIKSMDWDFENDGKYELQGKENLRPQYTFDKIGDYKVHLRIVDGQDNVNNFYRVISVVENKTPNITASFEMNPGGATSAPVAISFDAGKSFSTKGQIVRYEWNFGDGSDLQSGKTVSHKFLKPGRYNVTLKVMDSIKEEGETSAEVDLQAEAVPPTAAIRTLPVLAKEAESLTGEIPFTVKFDAGGSQGDGIVDYAWDFTGDGKADETGQKTEYTFTQAGDYAVSLTATNSQKLSNTVTLKIKVIEPGVKVSIQADPVDGPMPLVVNFDASGSTAFRGKIVSYTWNFGDSTPEVSTGAKITHRFDKVGAYTATLNLATDQNESAKTTQVIYVREVPLVACFFMSRKQGKAPLTVSFDSECATGTIANYSWNFGDGNTSDTRKGAHTFERPGEYKVKLEVLDSKNNVSTFQDTVIVEGELK